MWILLPVFLVLLGPIQGSEQETRTCSTCNEMLVTAMREHDLGIVTTEEELEQMCRDLDKGMNCHKDLQCSNRSTNNQRESMASSREDLCHSNRQEYLAHSKCLKEISDSYCPEYNQAVIDVLDRSGNNESKVTNNDICCGFSNFIRCMREVENSEKDIVVCNRDSFRWIEGFQLNILTSNTRLLCKVYLDDHENFCNSKAPHTVSHTMPLVAALSLLLLPLLLYTL